MTYSVCNGVTHSVRRNVQNQNQNQNQTLVPCLVIVSGADQIQSDRHLGRVAAAIGIGLFALITLTGCTSEPTPEPPNSGTNGPIVEERITLNDGRGVTCLTYDRALSCDWGSAR